MQAANGNEPLNEIEGFVENVLDDLVAEAALDEGSAGALDLRVVLIEMAARAMARTAFGYDLNPLEVREVVLGRFSTLLTEALERA